MCLYAVLLSHSPHMNMIICSRWFSILKLCCSCISSWILLVVLTCKSRHFLNLTCAIRLQVWCMTSVMKTSKIKKQVLGGTLVDVLCETRTFSPSRHRSFPSKFSTFAFDLSLSYGSHPGVRCLMSVAEPRYHLALIPAVTSGSGSKTISG